MQVLDSGSGFEYVVHDVSSRYAKYNHGKVFRGPPKGIMVHRVGKDQKYGINLGDTAESIADHFVGQNKQYPEVAKATGGMVPYNYVITGAKGIDGNVYKLLPDGAWGPHAMAWSSTHYGVAMIGDFRYHPPTANQWHALTFLCADLLLTCDIYTQSLQEPVINKIFGHTDVRGSSSDQNKRCPGSYVNISHLRDEVAKILSDMGKSGIDCATIVRK